MTKNALAGCLCLSLLSVMARAELIGLAESARAYEVTRGGVVETRGGGGSAAVATGDVLVSQYVPVLVNASGGSSILLDADSEALLVDSRTIELRSGGVVAAGTASAPPAILVSGLRAVPIEMAGTERVMLGARTMADGVCIISEGSSVALIDDATGERVATLGPSDQMAFRRDAAGQWKASEIILQEQQFVPDPSMPEEDDESRKGFFWRFWGLSVGGTVASAAAVGAAGAVVVVGGGAAVNQTVNDDDDDSDDDGGDPDDPPPPVSPPGSSIDHGGPKTD